MKNVKQEIHIQERLAHKIVRRTTIRGTFLTALGAVLWAFSSACGQFLMQKKGFSPDWLASTRILIAGVILTVFGSLVNKGSLKRIFKSGRDVLTLACFGVFGFMLAQYSFLRTIDASDSATATVLQYTAPIIIVAAVCIRTRRAPSITEASSMVLAVTGVFLLSTHGSFSSLNIKGEALIWGIASAVGMVFFSLIPVKIIPKYGSIVVTGLGMIFGGIAMLFVARPWTYTVHFDVESVLAYIGIAIVGTTVGYTLYTQGVSDVGSARASMIASIEPVTSAIFASLLGTMFGVIDIIGMACIIVTIFILSIPPKKIRISFHPIHIKHKKTLKTGEEK